MKKKSVLKKFHSKPSTKTCKECGVEKSLDDFYSHPLTSDWKLWRCKECVKNGRKSEKERFMARLNDKKRQWTKKRKESFKKYKETYKKKHNDKISSRRQLSNFLRYNENLKPKFCSHCNSLENLEYHHEDYNFPFKVISLCVNCHRDYHNNKIKIDLSKEIDLKNIY